MRLNYFTKSLSRLGRVLAIAFLCVTAFAFGWQGSFLSNHQALAGDAGNAIKGKVNNDTSRAKNFVRDAADKVEDAASSNANKVDRATDGGNFVERKARRDAARIHKRAEEDASRTEKAIDNTKNAVKGTVDNIKKAFDDD